MAIPKAGRQEHLLDNWRSQQLQIPQAALESLEAMFPMPKRKGALAMR
jgi:diketogulonate reductase-like aldo/keto reductase